MRASLLLATLLISLALLLATAHRSLPDRVVWIHVQSSPPPSYHGEAMPPLPEDFAAAQVRVKALSTTPSADELLSLYALYKQATAGDVTGSAPGMFDFKARAKHEAWARRAGMSREAAMTAYVELVATLLGKYGAAPA